MLWLWSIQDVMGKCGNMGRQMKVRSWVNKESLPRERTRLNAGEEEKEQGPCGMGTV